MKIALATLLLLTNFAVAASAVDDNLLSQNLIVSEIELQGLKRTDKEVVELELLLSEGQPLEQAQYQESLQRLKNLRIFSKVDPMLTRVDDRHVKVTSKFEEKWTTVPVMRGSAGGDALYFVIGAYDINAFGKYKEVGGQYENYDGEHSGVVWYRNPRFLKKRLLFGTDIWSVARPYAVYDDNSDVQQRFVLQRKKVNAFLDWEWKPWLVLGTGVEFNRDELVEQNQNSAFYQSNANIMRLNFTLGRVNYDNYLLSGHKAKFEIEQTLGMMSNDENFSRATLNAQAYFSLPWKSYLALHVRGGISNSVGLQHYFYLGGLENIRGYFDNQFRGNAFWQTNLEYRIPSYRSGALVLQHTFFIDAAQIASDANELFDSSFHSSYGTGIRFISPKIYRLTLRLDVAFPTTTTKAGSVSFGAQQFF